MKLKVMKREGSKTGFGFVESTSFILRKVKEPSMDGSLGEEAVCRFPNFFRAHSKSVSSFQFLISGSGWFPRTKLVRFQHFNTKWRKRSPLLNFQITQGKGSSYTPSPPSPMKLGSIKLIKVLWKYWPKYSRTVRIRNTIRKHSALPH